MKQEYALPSNQILLESSQDAKRHQCPLKTLRLPLPGNKHVTIISAYAVTMTNPDEVKDKFYDDLDSIISATSRTDKLNLIGDFNAKVDTEHQHDRLRGCR